jgi:hypothetical protein
MRILLMMVLAGVGCGRLGFGDESPGGGGGDIGGNETVGIEDTSPKAPQVCEVVGSLATTNTTDVDLSVATTPSGASVFWVATAGSSLRGFDLATDRTPSATVVVRGGTSFTASAAAYVDGRLLAGVISSSRALIHDVPVPIAAATEIGNFDGEYVGKLTLTHAGPDRIVATSCSSGLTMNAFDNLWNGTEATFTESSDQTASIDVTKLSSDAFAVWSTDTECHFERIASRTTGTMRMTNAPCRFARLAATSDAVAMAYENGPDVGFVIDDAATIALANALAIPGARSPRVLWSGSTYWVSYIDASDHIVVGYVDGSGMLLTTQLPDAAPATHAYELAMYDGQPWLFGVDDSMQVYANRFCIP